uniref:DUF2723 domain-containing protein n=1 Tax=Pseudictyota dubia TaxID=2749911 RepID=A0A7R9WJN7_9STRA|mmetsp:Transcript_5222/g.9061  ORF Transcript_5222/g.9061 Transcript_5222/m.9061 type:complete len:534 (+) Transcript_5222:605-2206(+)
MYFSAIMESQVDNAIASVAVLSLLIRTVPEGVPGGDAGELLAEACHYGVAHPPGYPLFTLLSGAVMRLSRACGSGMGPAQTINALCAVLGAMTCFFIGRTTAMLCSLVMPKDAPVGPVSAISGVLFALSPLVWEYSIGAEVFALNNMLCSLLLYCAGRVAMTSSTGVVRECAIGAFISGLALSNQHTSLLFIAPIVVYAMRVLHRHKKLSVKTVSQCGMCFFFGLLPYSYLHYASRTPAPGSWGDLTSVRGFLRHIARTEYGTLKLAPNLGEVEGWFERWKAYGAHALKESHIVGLALAIVGAAHAIHREVKQIPGLSANTAFGEKRHRIGSGDVGRIHFPCSTFAATFLFYQAVWNGLFSNLPLSFPMAYAVHSRFWMQPSLILCVFSGTGIAVVLSSLDIGKKAKTCLGRILLLATYIHCAHQHFHSMDKSGSNGMVLSDYGNAILDTIPPNSLLVAHTDLDWNTVSFKKQYSQIHYLFCGEDFSLLHLFFLSLFFLFQGAVYSHLRECNPRSCCPCERPAPAVPMVSTSS